MQNAELTIKAAKLASFAGQDSFTYKCAVGYPGSEISAPIDVVANVLTFGKFGKNICDIFPKTKINLVVLTRQCCLFRSIKS